MTTTCVTNGSDSKVLTTFKFTLIFSSNSFGIAAPHIWNLEVQTIVNRFRSRLQSWSSQFTCNTCIRMFLLDDTKRNMPQYRSCASQRAKGERSEWDVDNDMDPGIVRCLSHYFLMNQVPEAWKGLSQLEEMLISRIHCIVSVYTTRGGQRKSSKHIINFWQNIDRVAQELPLQPGTDDVPLLVRRAMMVLNIMTFAYEEIK